MNITFASRFRTKVKPITIILLLFLCFPGVMAQTVSFAQPDTLTQKDIYLYAANGTLLGQYNTTSTGIELPGDTDVIFTIKPQYATPLDDPSGYLNGIFTLISTNATSLLLIAFIGMLLFKKV